MKASELIEKLKEQIKEHGDIEVTITVVQPWQDPDVWKSYSGKARSVFFEKGVDAWRTKDSIVIHDEAWLEESK